MSSEIGNTPAADENITVKKTRNRRSNNCVPCRQRKKQCDRRVPGCSQCRLRNEVHLCCWGDERDEIDAPASKRIRLEATQIPLRSYTVEDSSDLLDTLSRADTDASPASAPLFTQSANVPARKISASISQAHRSTSSSLSSNQARHLLYCFQEHASKAFTLIDRDDILNALDAHGVVQEIKKDKADVYALILIVCASTLILLPPTLSISFGLITRSSEMRKLIDKWEKEAFDTLDELDMFHNPTLIGIQCMAVHQLNLAFLNSGRIHVRRTDELIRTCRRMGLDQLGSPQDDEDIWTKQDHRSVPAIQSGYWAADTLSRRDRKARNEGRALWAFCCAKDWACSRLSGSCGIHPLSYTTSTPQLYTSGPSGVTVEDAIVWKYISSASIITYDFFNLCIKAQATGSKLDYDKILHLDARLMSELNSRPDWLRPELWNTTGRGGPHMYDAILVSCTFWQRLFALHRPFLALSRSDPEKYGLSSSRSYEYAILCIRFMREGLQQGILMLKQLAFHHRLLQAALVVITHLFLSNDLDMHETISIHQELNFAISAIKELDIADDEGYFHGQGERLETLLAISARIKLDKMGPQDHRKCLLRDRSRWRDQVQESSLDGTALESPGQEDLYTHLDDQLMKLSQAWPQGPEEMNLDSIWQDVLSLLDPNATT